jgi:hypothetical protein
MEKDLLKGRESFGPIKKVVEDHRTINGLKYLRGMRDRWKILWRNLKGAVGAHLYRT